MNKVLNFKKLLTNYIKLTNLLKENRISIIHEIHKNYDIKDLDKPTIDLLNEMYKSIYTFDLDTRDEILLIYVDLKQQNVNVNDIINEIVNRTKIEKVKIEKVLRDEKEYIESNKLNWTFNL